jgi:hypothetical protein
MTKALTSLQSQKLIKLYRVDGREYGIFATWEKHQGKPRASKSKYPEALDSFLQADESGCEHLLANAPGGPNTNTDTNTDKREGSGEGGRRKGKRPISEEDKPSEKHFAYGQRLGVDVGPEWGKFYNYCKAHDRRYADFDAAFRNWLANAANFTKKVPHAVR